MTNPTNKTRLRRCMGVGLILAVSLVLALTTKSIHAQETQSSQSKGGDAQGALDAALFINQVATARNLPTDRLEVVNQVETYLALTGVSFYEAKVLDTQTGQEYGAALDANGNTIDGDVARAREEGAYRKRYGKLQPALVEKMAASGDSVLVAAILVHPPDLSDLQHRETNPNAPVYKLSPEQNDAARQQAITAVGLRVAAVTGPVVSDLRKAGYRPRAFDGVPLVLAQLPASAIRLLALRPDIDLILDGAVQEEDSSAISTRPGQDGALFLNRKLALDGSAESPDFVGGPRDFSRTMERIPQMEQRFNYVGYNMRVAIVSGDAINPNNPYLYNSDHPIIYFTADRTQGAATAAAGVIASSDGNVRGRAPFISRLQSANYGDFTEDNLIDASLWAHQTNSDIMEYAIAAAVNSDPSGFDWLTWIADKDAVWPYYNTIVAPTNRSVGGSATPRAPANAWNVLAVGMANGNNLPYGSSGFGEGHFTSNFHYDPSSNHWTTLRDHQKPDVMGLVATNSTTNSAPWVGSDSYMLSGVDAAAAVAGHAAALMQANRSYLQQWPEVVRAIILAGADSELVDVPTGTDPRIKAVDGIWEGWLTYEGTRGNHYSGGYAGLALTRGSFDANGNYDATGMTFSVGPGEKARVAIVWDGNPGTELSDPTYHGLDQDFDLLVMDSNNNVVPGAVSTAYDQAHEVVEFSPSGNGGYYHLRIRKYRFNGNNPGQVVDIGMAINTFAAHNPQTDTYQSPCWAATFVPAGGGTYYGDLRIGANYWDSYMMTNGYTIPWAENGPEGVYYKYTGVQGYITATLQNTYGQDLDIFIVQGDGNYMAPACGRNDATLGSSHTKQRVVAYGDTQAAYHVTQPGYYGFIVDGYNSASGAYQLNIQWKPIQPPSGTPLPTEPPTDTPAPTVTVPPHDTPATEPPTSTAAPGGTELPTRTEPPTVTPFPSPNETEVELTNTAVPSDTPVGPHATVTPCAIHFTDVQPDNPFYQYIMWLACNSIINGYPDGTFHPGNNATRAQFTKMIVLGIGWPAANPPTNTFADVLPGSTFFSYVETAFAHGIINGYPCGGPGEPCDPQHRPYFRPNNNITRGQLSKLLMLARGWALSNPANPTFADVAPGSTFYSYVETVAQKQIASGYQCGGLGEPCDAQHRPYFRPNNNATRGQLSKMLYITLDLPQSP